MRKTEEGRLDLGRGTPQVHVGRDGVPGNECPLDVDPETDDPRFCDSKTKRSIDPRVERRIFGYTTKTTHSLRTDQPTTER